VACDARAGDAMKRAAWLVLVAACSSPSHERAAGKGSANAKVAPADAQLVAHAQLPWKPLEIDHQPVVELRPQAHLSKLGVTTKFDWIGGTATTTQGSYALKWKLDSFEATPGRGRGSLPDGTWLTDIHSEGDKFVLSLGTGSHFDAFETDDEPIEVIAQYGETKTRVLVFREGVRWRFAHASNAQPKWTIDELPIKGANVASAVDPFFMGLVLAWNEGDQGVWMHVPLDTTKLPAIEKLDGKITSTCPSDQLWITTDKGTLRRLPVPDARSPGDAPTIVACNHDAAIVRLADGTAKRCAYTCSAVTLPEGEPTVQALIGEDLVAVEQRDNILAITRHGKRTEYDQGGVIQRMQLVDFDGTPVLVAFGRQGLDPTRWTVIP
jgi:hypothetical protein